MGPNVLTSRCFQVLLTEMGLPIHPALLCARTPKAVPSVIVTMLLFPAWPWGEAVHPLGLAAPRLLPGERICSVLGQAGSSSSAWIDIKFHCRYGHRALMQPPKGTCCIFKKSCIFFCCLWEVRGSWGCTCLCCNYNWALRTQHKALLVLHGLEQQGTFSHL